MPVITIIIFDGPRQNVGVATTEPQPTLGRMTTSAETLAADLLRRCRNDLANDAIAYSVRGLDMRRHVSFLTRLLDRESLGWAVSDEVRDEARALLSGLPKDLPELATALRGVAL